MQDRQLKVQYQWRERCRSPFLHSVPSIRLSGEWLRRAGFEIGEKVTVKVEPGRLTVLAENGGTYD